MGVPEIKAFSFDRWSHAIDQDLKALDSIANISSDDHYSEKDGLFHKSGWGVTRWLGFGKGAEETIFRVTKQIPFRNTIDGFIEIEAKVIRDLKEATTHLKPGDPNWDQAMSKVREVQKRLEGANEGLRKLQETYHQTKELTPYPNGYMGFKYPEGTVTEKEILIPTVTFRAKVNTAIVDLVQSDKLHQMHQSGTLWDHIGSEPNGPGRPGRIHIYDIKPEFDPQRGTKERQAYEAEQVKLFPAVEPDPRVVVLFSKKVKGNPLEPFLDAFKLLGFEFGKHFKIPDSKTLLDRWPELQKIYPGLAPLDLSEEEGIATDRQFVEVLLSHDVLISTKKEVLHDTFGHLIQKILEMLTLLNDYTRQRDIVRIEVRKVLERIDLASKEIAEGKIEEPMRTLLEKHLDKLVTILGVYYDSNNDRVLERLRYGKETKPEEIRSELYTILEHWENLLWPLTFWEKRFGGTHEFNEIAQVAKYITDSLKAQSS